MTVSQLRLEEHLELPHARPKERLLIVVMGVSGCGKSTLGSHLASALRLPFIDADDLHPPSNVAKMSRGEPLTDEDRAPWLERVSEAAAAATHITANAHTLRSKDGHAADHPSHDPDCHPPPRLPDHPATLPRAPEDAAHPDETEVGGGAVVACSALKRAYRDVLRGGPLRTVFVHPHGTYEILLSRMSARKDHFMKASMLESQFAVLEDPTGEEGLVKTPVEAGMREQVDIALTGLEQLGVVRRK